MKKDRIEVNCTLRYLLWQASVSEILEATRSYCICLSDGELAARIMEMAVNIDHQFQNYESAIEIEPRLIELKEVATGLTIDDAKGMCFVADVQEINKFTKDFKNEIKVDPLMREVLKNYE